MTTHFQYALSIIFKDMPKAISLLLAASVLMWILHGMKKLEPYVFPVVVDFKIEEVRRDGLKQYVRGSFTKLRDCKPLEVVGYHNNDLLFLEMPKTRKTKSLINRTLGHQNFDWWQVIPPVPSITIYSRHACSTGTVITKLYEGHLLENYVHEDDL